MKFENIIRNNIGSADYEKYTKKMNDLAKTNFDFETVKLFLTNEKDAFYESNFLANSKNEEGITIQKAREKILEEYEKVKRFERRDRRYCINIQHIYDIKILGKSGEEIYFNEGLKIISKAFADRVADRLMAS